MSRPRHRGHVPLATALAVVVAFAVLAGCHRHEANEPDAAEAPNVDNATLGLRLAALPDGLVVAVNEGRRLELEPADAGAGGRISIEVWPTEAGQNIPAAVADHRAAIEARPGGVYQGSQELTSPLGTSFYSRGRFDSDDGAAEQTVVFALHPAGGRMLTLSYLYPAGQDSSVRVQQLLDLLAVVEGM